MKYLSLVVPAYNSQDYLEKCLDSVVSGGEDVEVIVINDGSTDNTETIARQYQKKYPNIVRVITQENGGHGSAINTGLANATGLFFKVVDSDDWLDIYALRTLIDRLKLHQERNNLADLYVTNFVYNRTSENKTFVRSFKKKFKHDTYMTWKNVNRFYGAQVLLMHSLTFNTEKLKKSHTILPHHTFYVDNLYAYKPLPYMEKIYYLNIDLYHYYIGREDQSVNINIFVNRYDQQIRVMKEMVKAYSYDQIGKFDRGLKKYMYHCLGAIMMITILFTTAKDDPERRSALLEMWKFIKTKDRKLYIKLRLLSAPIIVNYLPWRIRGIVMVSGYKYLRRRLKLG